MSATEFSDYTPDPSVSRALAEAEAILKQGRNRSSLTQPWLISPPPTKAKDTEPVNATTAREILGEDFLGLRALNQFNERLNGIGAQVRFALSPVGLPYTRTDLEIAKNTGEMLIVRPNTMFLGGVKLPITIRNLIGLFSQDPLNRLPNPVGGVVISRTMPEGRVGDYLVQEAEMTPGMRLVSKDVCQGSTNRSFQEQASSPLHDYHEFLVEQGAQNVTLTRRSPLEAIWDTIFYYVINERQLLADNYDMVRSALKKGEHHDIFQVGGFDSNGLKCQPYPSGQASGIIGTCTVR